MPKRKPLTKPHPTNSSAPIAPPTNLTLLAGRIPAEILQQLSTAIQSGQWLFAIWHVAHSKIQLERTATNFPTIDLDPAVKLLSENLNELKVT